MSYTNTSGTNGAGTSGRTPGATIANTASAIIGHMPHTGTATGNTGPFIPLMSSDVGIRSIQSAQFSAAQATANGCVNLILYKPLVSLPITTAFVATERDLMNQLPSMPQIKDGACLGIFVFSGAVIAAGNQFQGYIDSAWG